ncbi:hypothetical protein D4764_02G0009240 [Takifugu flavidus]|uniref:DDE-1 domain-containing protein n=1 Tax=Takifugu flavidus TaxID=433684 RepID=A0A5C6NL13_9TELE|nr:hypothetical protein D4764_02G0009240 [Takifugu flavidus]
MAIEQLQDILMEMSPWSESGENKKVNESEEDEAEFPREQSKVARAGRPSGTVGCGTANKWKGRLYVTICQKAKAITDEMDIEHFQGGLSWCFRFMRRRPLSIRARTTVAQQLPADYQERAAIFRTDCRDKITAPSHIYGLASYATICGWIVDAWAMIPSSCIGRAFTKAGINAEAEPVGESDSDDEEEEFGMLDIEIVQLFNSDTEDENFDGFVAEE